MTIADEYIQGLKQAYIDNDARDYWEHFERIIHGASIEGIWLLKKKYPQLPASLVSLLAFVDGTDGQNYRETDVSFIFLGSKLGDYPYYLQSAQQILESKDIDLLEDYINRTLEPEWGIYIDDKIINDFNQVNWLHFSDCINNGGSSKLYIDFSPSPKGKFGQVVMHVHDPDKLTVIADSFDDYLRLLISRGYEFIDEDISDNYDF